MSDLTANDSSSFSNIGCHTSLQDVSRPKFQPIRVKALLHFCESDDDDDDESEKSHKSHDPEDELEFDEPQPLPQDNPAENVLQELSLHKEDQQHNSAQSFIEQASKKREEESSNCKSSNAESKAADCVPQIASENSMYSATKYGNSQYGIGKYEANDRNATVENARLEFNTPSLSDTGRSLSMVNRLITDTPVKHMQVNSIHPNPCTSHKQLFCTPQNKLPSDKNKSHIQTPSTILSSWFHNMRQTPMSGKTLIAKDHVQTSSNTVYTSTTGKKETARYFGMDAKNTRRPLLDTTLAHNNDLALAYPLESKSHMLQACSEVKCVTSDSQQEDRSRKTIALPEVKVTQIEANYDTGLRSMNLVEETKKDQQLNIPNTFIENSRKTTHDKKENKLVVIGSNAGLKVKQEPSRRYNDENNVPNEESKDLQDRYSGHKKHREELRQIADKVANVQFSVPFAVPSQRSGKTLLVKDKEYLTLGFLGQGMSGEVLRVQDMSCGELRAIKCVDLSKMDKEAAQGCLDEISLLRKLQAPCVIRMFDYHIRESMVYVVMEMGDTDFSRLLNSMSQEKQIPLTMILYYWTEMLTAVKHIHDNGVIHSDLKPANFLLVRGRLKLIDFGIASNINSDMTSVLKNNSFGTLNYISPEALMDINSGNADSPTHNVKYKISFKSDVWSLGCILYYLVYGHTPFHHIRSQWAKVHAITNPKPNILFPTTRTLSNGELRTCERTPLVLIDVMRKCFQHDPKARPTVSQLLQVEYVPTKPDVTPISVPEIPANILVKVKRVLNEEEWRQLVQVLDTKRQHI